MNTFKPFFIVFFFLLLSSVATAQVENSIPERIIVKSSKRYLNQFSSQLRSDNFGTLEIETLDAEYGYFILNSDDNLNLYEKLKEDKNIEGIQWDKKLEWRKRPNDPRLNSQNYLEVIKAFDAWNLSTGGKSTNDEEVVIAVIDEGFDIAHEDLANNIFRFPNEIANDGIDNDNNGTIDDINGWNQADKSGTHRVRSHGTNVVGVLGAEGNNDKGIAGINWNTKILLVSSGSLVSDVIASNLYIIRQKQDYLNSGGTKGVNICVLNYSAGLTGSFGSDFPNWCSTYDALGQVGILSVVATANERINIDVEGDVPATCPSPYLLVVTSTGSNDELEPDSAFGAMNVDLAAPGTNILTTDLAIKGTYKNESGTSLSTPMVAGAAALLNTTDCVEFNKFIKENPTQAPLIIRQALIDGVNSRNSLRTTTTSGGRLNIFESLRIIYTDFCEEDITPVSNIKINTLEWRNNTLTLDYATPYIDQHTLKIYDTSGKEIYTQTFTPTSSRKKIISADLNRALDGFYYYVSIIHGKEVVSKGFATRQ